MRKVILTTIFWALIVIIAGFYLKFMDQELGQQAANWIMSIDTTTQTNTGGEMSGDVQDPTQTILSGMIAMQQQLTDQLSGLNAKLDETKTFIEENMKAKTPAPKKVGTGSTTTTGTGTN